MTCVVGLPGLSIDMGALRTPNRTPNSQTGKEIREDQKGWQAGRQAQRQGRGAQKGKEEPLSASSWAGRGRKGRGSKEGGHGELLNECVGA